MIKHKLICLNDFILHEHNIIHANTQLTLPNLTRNELQHDSYVYKMTTTLPATVNEVC